MRIDTLDKGTTPHIEFVYEVQIIGNIGIIYSIPPYSSERSIKQDDQQEFSERRFLNTPSKTS